MGTLAKGINTIVHAKDLPVPDALPLTTMGLAQVDYSSEPIASNLYNTFVERISANWLKEYWQHKGQFQTSFTLEWIDQSIIK